MWRKVIISTKTKVMKLVEKSFPKCNGLGNTSKYSSIILKKDKKTIKYFAESGLVKSRKKEINFGRCRLYLVIWGDFFIYSRQGINSTLDPQIYL